MKFYVTAIGSGKSLNYPHQKKYDGVLALVENTKDFGFKYKGKDDLKQDKIFYSKYDGTNYEYKRWLQIDSWQSTYNIGKQIITELDNIKKQYPSVKFHFEISAGYKRIGSILTLISYIRNSDIYKLTFLSHENVAETFPIIKIDLHPKEREILEGFRKGIEPGWNEKINMNKYVLTYPKDKKYVYKILKKCKEMGILDENNRVTDFGNLYLDYC
jgi:hypothetical protein